MLRFAISVNRATHESSIELLTVAGMPEADTVITDDDDDFTRLLERLQEIIKTGPEFANGWTVNPSKMRREIAIAFHKMIDEKLAEVPDRVYMPGDEYVLTLRFQWT